MIKTAEKTIKIMKSWFTDKISLLLESETLDNNCMLLLFEITDV